VAEFAEILGLEFAAPPDDWTPLDVVGVIHCLDENGIRRYWTLVSDSVTDVDALGMLRWRTLILEDEIVEEAMLIEDSDDDG
jgi:hypothetical protein